MGQILTVRTAANTRLRQPGFAAGDYALFELSIGEIFTEKSNQKCFVFYVGKRPEKNNEISS